MKKLKSLFVGFSILSLFVLSGLVCSCESEPEPQLTEPELSLALSETSPQTEVIISWTPSDEAESYRVERTMIRDSVTDTRYFEWRESDELCSKDDSKFYLTDNTCESGTEYTYVVTASASWYAPEIWHTTSKSSKEKSIKTAADPKVQLAYPKNVKVEQMTGNRNSLTVSWDAVQNAVAYEVWYTTSSWTNFNEKFVKLGQTEQTSYTKKYLPNESSYVFMIKAIKDDEYSLLSAKATGTVAPVDNLTRSTAIPLENGIREYFYSDSESLWYKCTPQKGILSFYCGRDFNDNSLSIFLEDGTVVASGLPLFYLEEGTDENLSLLTDEDYDFAVARNFKNDIKDFSPGTTYILRIVRYSYKYFSLCVE